MSSIYQDIIIDHYRSPHNYGNIENPSATVDVSNPLCGDKIHMQMRAKDGKIDAISFTGVGCAISIASASMLTDYVHGKTIQETGTIQKEIVLELLGIQL